MRERFPTLRPGDVLPAKRIRRLSEVASRVGRAKPGVNIQGRHGGTSLSMSGNSPWVQVTFKVTEVLADESGVITDQYKGAIRYFDPSTDGPTSNEWTEADGTDWELDASAFPLELAVDESLNVQWDSQRGKFIPTGHPPDVYVALPQTGGGIPALSLLGSVPAAGDTPGSALCDIYKVGPSGTLIPVTGISKLVYNTAIIAVAKTWIIVEMSRYGKWFVAVPPPSGLVEQRFELKDSLSPGSIADAHPRTGGVTDTDPELVFSVSDILGEYRGRARDAFSSPDNRGSLGRAVLVGAVWEIRELEPHAMKIKALIDMSLGLKDVDENITIDEVTITQPVGAILMDPTITEVTNVLSEDGDDDAIVYAEWNQDLEVFEGVSDCPDA